MLPGFNNIGIVVECYKTSVTDILVSYYVVIDLRYQNLCRKPGQQRENMQRSRSL